MAFIEFTFLASLTAALLSGVVLLGRGPVARWIGPHTAYALWLLPLLRAILPAAPGTPMIEGPHADPTVLAPAPAAMSAPAPEAAPPVWHVPAVDAETNAPTVIPPPQEAPAATRTAPTAPAPTDPLSPAPAPAPDPATRSPMAAPPATTDGWGTAAANLVSASALLWAFVTVVLLGNTVLGAWRFGRRVHAETAPAPAALRAELAGVAAQAGLSRVPELRLCPKGSSPYLTGVLRPVIVLPWSVQDSFTPTERRVALLHEVLHCRRFDIPVRFAMALFTATQWYVPWRGRVLSAFVADQEASCDAHLLAMGGAAPAPYARTLVKAATGPAPAGPAFVLSMGHPLKERIARMQTRRTLKGGAAIAAVTITGVLAATAAVLPRQEAEAPEDRVRTEDGEVTLPHLLGGPDDEDPAASDPRGQSDRAEEAVRRRRGEVRSAERYRADAVRDRVAAAQERAKIQREAAFAAVEARMERAEASMERAEAFAARAEASMERAGASWERQVERFAYRPELFPQIIHLNTGSFDIDIDTEQDGIVILSDVLDGMREQLDRLGEVEIDIDIPEPPAPPEDFMVRAVEIITESGERIAVPGIPVFIPERQEAYIEEVTAMASRIAEMNIDGVIDDGFRDRAEANARAIEALVDRCKEHQERSDAPRILTKETSPETSQKILCFSGGEETLRSERLARFVERRGDLSEEEKARFAEAQEQGSRHFQFHYED